MARFTTLEENPIFAGIDYHKRFSVVSLGDKEGKLILTQKLPNDCKVITEFFSAYPGLICTIESCRGYEWLVDWLKNMDLTVYLANPYEVKLIAKSKSKSDRVDSRILMQLLAMGFLPTCYQPSPEERRIREQLRWRSQLIRTTTRIKLCIHSLLDKENLGLQDIDLFSLSGREYLRTVKLSGPGRQELLQKQLEFLSQVEPLVNKEDGWIYRTAKDSAEASLLLTIPGVGHFSSLVILSELGDIRRFKRSSQVVSFAGLYPSTRASADTRHNGRISKQGSTFLRWVIIEDAWHAIKISPGLRAHYNSVAHRGGRNAAILSVARKLLKIVFRVLTDASPFQEGLIGNSSNKSLATGSAPRSA